MRLTFAIARREGLQRIVSQDNALLNGNKQLRAKS
jgi:hypothetical protein